MKLVLENFLHRKISQMMISKEKKNDESIFQAKNIFFSKGSFVCKFFETCNFLATPWDYFLKVCLRNSGNKQRMGGKPGFKLQKDWSSCFANLTAEFFWPNCVASRLGSCDVPWYVLQCFFMKQLQLTINKGSGFIIWVPKILRCFFIRQLL